MKASSLIDAQKFNKDINEIVEVYSLLGLMADGTIRTEIENDIGHGYELYEQAQLRIEPNSSGKFEHSSCRLRMTFKDIQGDCLEIPYINDNFLMWMDSININRLNMAEGYREIPILTFKGRMEEAHVKSDIQDLSVNAKKVIIEPDSHKRKHMICLTGMRTLEYMEIPSHILIGSQIGSVNQFRTEGLFNDMVEADEQYMLNPDEITIFSGVLRKRNEIKIPYDKLPEEKFKKLQQLLIQNLILSESNFSSVKIVVTD